MHICTYTNDRWYSNISWTYIQVLFEVLISLIKLLNMTMVRNFDLPVTSSEII
jgi:hypothetical protein